MGREGMQGREATAPWTYVLRPGGRSLSPRPAPSQQSAAAPARRLRTCTQHMPVLMSGSGARAQRAKRAGGGKTGSC